MRIDEFVRLVRTRRSYRRFKLAAPVPDECIEKMLESARWAMSGGNGQPWEFIVVRDRETIRKLNEIALAEKKEHYYCEQTRVAEYRQQIFAFGVPEKTGWEEAAVVIVVVGDSRRHMASVLVSNFIPAEGSGASMYLKNMANATQLLCLAAAAQGLATRWVSVTRHGEEAMKRLLDVPDVLDIHTIVPVGWPAYKPPPPYRRKLAEIVHQDKYDRGRYRSMQDIMTWLAELRKRSRTVYGEGYKKE